MEVSDRKERSVVITGLGVVSPFGVGVEALNRGLWSGACAVKPVLGYARGGDRIARFAPVVGYLDDAEVAAALERNGLDLSGLESHFDTAILAAAEALEASSRAGQPLPAKSTAISLGSGFGQLRLLERWVELGIFPKAVEPLELQAYAADCLPGLLARRFGLHGPRQLFSVACASSNFAIGDAVDLIRRGEAEAVLCGGAETFQESSLIGAAALGVIDPAPCRPFSAGRAGFNPGIAAAFLVLESAESARRRQARPLARILGFGASCDACHLTAPDMEGEGMSRAMCAALEDAGLAPTVVDYVNAHGTGTYLNDLVETRAIRRVLGRRAKEVPVSATKSQIGHCAGASAAVEAIACCLAVSQDRLPPTINYQGGDPECDLDYVPNRGRDCTVSVSLNNSFAFGGHNSCLVIAKAEVG